MKLEIDKDLIEKIANYLVTKPWIEVQGLLVELQKLKPVETQEQG
jgi:hypothetical protein